MTWGPKPAADILADISRLMSEIPALPVLTSCRLFPADKAHKFTHNEREYVIAHPDFWEKVPVRRQVGPKPLWGMEIVDMDLSANAHVRAKILGAYARVLITS